MDKFPAASFTGSLGLFGRAFDSI